MKYTLKSLLVTTVLALPAVMGSENLPCSIEKSDTQNAVAALTRGTESSAVGCGINVQEMREISERVEDLRNSAAEETLDVARVTQIDVATELKDFFRELDLGQNISDSTTLDVVYNQLILSGESAADKQRTLSRYQSIYNNVERYLNGIIDYKPYVIADIVTFQNMVLLSTCVIVHILLLK